CPNGKPYYKQCKEDRPRACREAGYVNSCSSGRLYATTNRCQWDSSYGKCCTYSPSAGCPSSYSVNCDASRGSSGTDTCGYTCYRCCDDNCPSGTSKNYTGSYASTTECGSRCNRCKDCSSGKTYWNGSYVGSAECGSCYSCSDTCSSGQKSVSCSWDEDKVHVSSTECGTSCYECQYNTDCSATDKNCSYGCSSYNSCGKCTSCNSKPPVSCSKHYTWQSGSVSGSTIIYTYSVTCQCSDGTSRSLGTETTSSGCWDCDSAHLSCKASCGNCYHSNPTYAGAPYYHYIDYSDADYCNSYSGGSC
ncbi:MAG: hypothetical protein SO314_07230, partial [Alphaproteobacteria bacterium]|nr:hypothetical protein [Alphaproteobacteria bacterium]